MTDPQPPTTPQTVVVEIVVMPRPGLLDPAGRVVEQRALPQYGITNVTEVRTGKAYRLTVAGSRREAKAIGKRLATEFFCNELIEVSEVRLR